ncbi:MAG: PepSY-associated TM helix domain-containing protein [Bacteroidales bacterium]|nr:PepSY-associated TM helix domain-containing protein [Bacteroidales bacterium]
MAFKWRKWNRAIHRDFGYLFFGMTVLYALSGIALNHRAHWNPNFIVIEKAITETPFTDKPDKEEVKDLLEKYGILSVYRKHYFPNDRQLKIFLTGGSAYVNLQTGKGMIEMTRRRPVFREINYLHYNPSPTWTWYSDIFSGALIVLAITGLLIPRAKDGITARGAWLSLLGILIPLLFIIYYLY